MNTTLIAIITIYLTIGSFIALVLHFSEYKVSVWNAVGIGVMYPYLILVAGFILTLSFLRRLIQ